MTIGEDNNLKIKKRWLKILIGIIGIPVFLFCVALTILYLKQDDLVKNFIETANADFQGKIELSGSHIEPFDNFPYLSIDLENFRIYETKSDNEIPIIEIADVLIGFNIFTLFSDSYDINSVKLSNGKIDLYMNENGSLNLLKALETTKAEEELKEDFHFNLKQFTFENIDLSKTNSNGLTIDGFFHFGDISLSSNKNHLFFSVNSSLDLSIIENGDTSVIHDKNFRIDSKLDYFKESQTVDIERANIDIESSKFDLSGTIDILNDLDLDLKITGEKSDFSLLIGLAPDDYIPMLNIFENRGKVYFSSTIKGKSGFGYMPCINVEFGCKNGFFRNSKSNRSIEDLNFIGSFTTTEQPSFENMKFEIKDFSAKPETGEFGVNLKIENFNSPEIELGLNTKFNLNYLAELFDISSLENLNGDIQLKMNFHDIIDLNHPEKSIQKLNESYYSEISIDNLSFYYPDLDINIIELDMELKMDGHEAELQTFKIKTHNSDFFSSGSISDLPALIHHSNLPVEFDLIMRSKSIDLTDFSIVNFGKINDLNLDLRMISSAQKMVESSYLPEGEFFIDNFNASFTNFPHAIHDFHADLIIDSTLLRLIDFTGMVDDSDFNLTASMLNYPIFLSDNLSGISSIDFDITSNLLQMEDILSFGGEDLLPTDYRNEQFENLKLHGQCDLNFHMNEFTSLDANLTEFKGKMDFHHAQFDKFKGKVHYDNNHLTLRKFSGVIGKSNFNCDLDLFIADDTVHQNKPNQLKFRSTNLDFDELLIYEEAESNNHDSIFSIFDIPFPNMEFEIEIDKLNYHKYKIFNFSAIMRTEANHFLYFDTLQMNMAGGLISMNGYFNGSNRSQIYFKPRIKLNNVNLDKLMFKFDNFGQDYLVSDNVHGDLSGELWGKIHLHADLIPIIDDSEIHFDAAITKGSLNEYGPLEALSGFFEDEKLHQLIFDTLSNHIDLTNGLMTIPTMLINTNLGFIEVSGTQDTDFNMEYYLKVPIKMISRAGSYKLFGRNKETDSNELYEYDSTKNYRYINLKITGDSEEYSVSLSKKKK